jgi:hypothetical protein
MTETDLPKALAWTERWALPGAAVACGVLVIANLLLNEIAEWLPMAIISLVMGPFAYWMVKALLRFQRVNLATMSPRTFRSAVWFFWGGAVSWVGVLLIALIQRPATGVTMAFGITIAAGSALAAARKWKDGAFFSK